MPEFHDFICFQMGLAARTLQKYYNSQYAAYGVTLPQSFILFALYKKDGLGVKALAEKLFIDSSAITGLIDRMEKEGLVVRMTDPDDRRAFQISLTEKGRKIAVEIFPITDRMNNEMKGSLEPEEWDAFMSFVNKIENNYR